MLPPDPLAAYQNAPLADLLAILLRQFRRPLANKGVDLSDAEAETLARAIEAGEATPEQTAGLRGALAALIDESETVLGRWGLTFEEALDTEISGIPGWETTAEFLEIANEKTNAELRISTGVSLLVALGDPRYLTRLRLLARRVDDLDGVIARRIVEMVEGRA